jgi:hypothetical protein
MSEYSHNLYTRGLLRNSFPAPRPFDTFQKIRAVPERHAPIRRVALLRPEAVHYTLLWKK